MVSDSRFRITGILKGIGYFVVYAVLMMIFQALLSIGFMAIMAAQGVRSESLLTSFANDNMLGSILGANILIGLVFVLIFKNRKRSIIKAWKLRIFTFNEVAVASVCTLTFTVLFILVKNILVVDEPDTIAASANYYATVFPGLGVLMLCLNLLIFAPVVEEIVLRGVVYNQIGSTTNKCTAIIGSALLFGVMHIMAGGLVLASGAFLMGVILGCIYARTNSLWVCIIAHSVANLPDIYLYLIGS